MIEIDDIPVGTLAVVALLIGAAVFMPTSLFSDGSPSKNGTVTNESSTSVRQLPENISEQLYPVPESHTATPTNSSEAPQISASAGSQTMQVSVREEDGEPKMILDDSDTHSGRWVSVPTEWIEQQAGDVPDLVTIDHSENGEYNARLFTREGSSTFYVREFSTNTVTFSSAVNVSAAAATDGTTLNYDVGNLSDPSDYEIAATGVKSTEYETESWTGVSSLTTDPHIAGNAPPENFEVTFTGRDAESNTFWEGTTASSSEATTIDVAGTSDPTNETVTFTGQETTAANSWSATSQSDSQSTDVSVGGNTAPRNGQVTFSGRETSSAATSSGTGSDTISVGGNVDPESQSVTVTGRTSATSTSSSATGVDIDSSNSLSVGGNVQPMGPASGEPEISVTGYEGSFVDNPVDISGDGTASKDGTLLLGTYYNEITQVEYRWSPEKSGTLDTLTVNMEGTNGGDYDENIRVRIHTGTTLDDQEDGTVIASGIDVSHTGETQINVDDTSVTAGQDYVIELWPQSVGGKYSSGYFSSDSSASETRIKDGNDAFDRYPNVDHEVVDSPSSVTVSDDAGNTAQLGDFADGETKSSSLDLSLSSSEVNFNSAGLGTLDYTLSYSERTATENPSVDVDGDGTTDASWSGIYRSGESPSSQSVSALSTGSNSLTTATAAGPQPDWTLSYHKVTRTENPSVDVNSDGTADASHSGILQPGENATVQLRNLPSGSVSVTTLTAAGITDWEITADEVTATEDPSLDIDDDGVTEASHSGVLVSGETATVAFDGLSTGSNTLGIDTNSPGTGWRIEATTISETTDPALDIGDDGTTDASYSGTLSADQSITRSVSVSSIPSTVTVTTTGGGTDVNLSFDEVTTTPSGSVAVNGNTPSTWAALSPGESTGLATNTSWITGNQNTVNVSMDTSTLSADAPSAKVGINYSHTANQPVSASVSDEKWSQRYTVSKTWGANQTDARVTVPLRNNVIDVRELTRSTNGGAFTSVNATNYTLDENASELTVQFGDVTAGTNVTVRANMTKVQVQNGEIDVAEPTLATNTLNSKIELTDWQQTSFIAVGGTRNANHTVYTDGESWSTVESTYYVDAAGNRHLRMPNAGTGATTDVKSTPLQVTLPDGGEVAIEVVNASDNGPRFRVDPGVNAGDRVRYELLNGRTDGTHALYGSDGDQLVSSEEQVLRYSDTADTFTIKFTTAAFASGGSGGGGGGGLLGDSTGTTLPLGAIGGTFVPLIAVALALAGLVVASRNDDAVQSAGDGAATTTQSALDGIPVVGPAIGGVAAGGIRSASQLFQAIVENRTFGVALGGAIVIGAVQLGIVRIPEGSGVILIVAGVGIGSLVALREVGEFSTERWVAVVTAATVVAIQTQSDSSLLTAIAESQVFPIVAVGGLYLAYRFVQGIRQPDAVTEIVVGGDGGNE